MYNVTCSRVASAQVARDNGQDDIELVHSGARKEIR